MLEAIRGRAQHMRAGRQRCADHQVANAPACVEQHQVDVPGRARLKDRAFSRICAGHRA
jgi:hypothetical protein